MIWIAYMVLLFSLLYLIHGIDDRVEKIEKKFDNLERKEP